MLGLFDYYTLSLFVHGPYPIVCLLPRELRRLNTSVPGLTQDVGGALHVANLVVGDILTSGDELSRPLTVLDVVVGTAREDCAVFKPCYLNLNRSGGLDVPWITAPPCRSRGVEARATEAVARLGPTCGHECDRPTPAGPDYFDMSHPLLIAISSVWDLGLGLGA